MNARNYEELYEELRRHGFVPREGRHRIWRHPLGPVTVTPRSPSDVRSFLNDRAQARRALRRVQELSAK